ncbi:MAG: translation initiation factor eIF-1A [Candidatus Micrarchaeota archaeon]
MPGYQHSRPYKPHGPAPIPPEQQRVRLPRGREVLGLVLGLMGGSRMRVQCKDGKERMCRIPGRMKNTVWVREGDIIIVEPYEIEGDKKGDVIWRYNPYQARWLKENGHI